MNSVMAYYISFVTESIVSLFSDFLQALTISDSNFPENWFDSFRQSILVVVNKLLASPFLMR